MPHGQGARHSRQSQKTRKNKYKGSKASDWPPDSPQRAREDLIGAKSRAKEGKTDPKESVAVIHEFSDH